MINEILYWGDLIVWGIVLIVLMIISYYSIFAFRRKNNNIALSEDRINKFCILIPARNESKVISNILESIKNQTFSQNFEDVYVIVESAEDPTCQIAGSYGAQVFIRTNLENRHRKGYALDECVQRILSEGKKYDAYFVFDADNILDKDYLRHMNSTFNKGYDLACGYRRPTNPNESVVSTCSALIFSLVNAFGNVERAKKNLNVTITGTGFYIRGSEIEKWGGYPFHSMTEDYELTMYATIYKLSSTYNERAIYLDEQPINMKTSNSQRIRWISGYMHVRKIYGNEIRKINKKTKSIDKIVKSLGIWPFVLMIVMVLSYLFFCTGVMIASFYYQNNEWINCLLRILLVIIAIYLLLVILTASLFITERGKTNYTFKSKFKACLFNPIFLASFVPLACKLIIKKNHIEWEEIKHNGK